MPIYIKGRYIIVTENYHSDNYKLKLTNRYITNRVR